MRRFLREFWLRLTGGLIAVCVVVLVGIMGWPLFMLPLIILAFGVFMLFAAKHR